MSCASAILEEFKPPKNQGQNSTLPAPDQCAELPDDAYRRGLEEGHEQARAKFDAATLTALSELNEKLGDAVELRDRITKQLSADFGVALAGVVRTLCPQLVALSFPQTVRSFIETDLAKTRRPLNLRAPHDLTGAIEELLSDVRGIDAIEADENLTGHRVEITWSDGSASIDAEHVAAKIIELAGTLKGVSGSQNEVEHD